MLGHFHVWYNVTSCISGGGNRNAWSCSSVFPGLPKSVGVCTAKFVYIIRDLAQCLSMIHLVASVHPSVCLYGFPTG